MSYTLEYLRYRLDLDVGDDVTAHRAGADVEVITKLLERIVADAIKYKIIDGDKDIGVQLVKITLEPEIIKTFPFGKHRDVPLKDIPTDYFNWALQNMDVFKEESEKYNPDLLYSIGLILEQRGVI
jgi:exodeoxyribonuclease X